MSGSSLDRTLLSSRLFAARLTEADSSRPPRAHLRPPNTPAKPLKSWPRPRSFRALRETQQKPRVPARSLSFLSHASAPLTTYAWEPARPEAAHRHTPASPALPGTPASPQAGSFRLCSQLEKE